jgi:hypothetical protein
VILLISASRVARSHRCPGFWNFNDSLFKYIVFSTKEKKGKKGTEKFKPKGAKMQSRGSTG